MSRTRSTENEAADNTVHDNPTNQEAVTSGTTTDVQPVSRNAERLSSNNGPDAQRSTGTITSNSGGKRTTSGKPPSD